MKHGNTFLRNPPLDSLTHSPAGEKLSAVTTISGSAGFIPDRSRAARPEAEEAEEAEEEEEVAPLESFIAAAFCLVILQVGRNRVSRQERDLK